jgi:hypothetical protein
VHTLTRFLFSLFFIFSRTFSGPRTAHDGREREKSLLFSLEKRYGRCIFPPKSSTKVYQLSTEGLPGLYRGSTGALPAISGAGRPFSPTLNVRGNDPHDNVGENDAHNNVDENDAQNNAG